MISCKCMKQSVVPIKATSFISISCLSSADNILESHRAWSLENTALRHVIQVEDCNLRVARGEKMGCEAVGREKQQQQLQSRSQKLRVHSLERTQTIAWFHGASSRKALWSHWDYKQSFKDSKHRGCVCWVLHTSHVSADKVHFQVIDSPHF